MIVVAAERAQLGVTDDGVKPESGPCCIVLFKKEPSLAAACNLHGTCKNKCTPLQGELQEHVRQTYHSAAGPNQ